MCIRVYKSERYRTTDRLDVVLVWSTKLEKTSLWSTKLETTKDEINVPIALSAFRDKESWKGLACLSLQE